MPGKSDALQLILTTFGLEFDEGKLAAIEKGTKRAEKNLGGIAKNVDKFGDGVKRGIRFAAGLVAAYVGLRTVKLFTTDVVDQVKALDNWAARLNTTTLQIEELAAVAKGKGVELDDLGDIMKEVGVRVGEAFVEGSKDQKGFFDELKISKAQLFDGTMQKNAREQFLVVADALSKMQDRARALQISDAMFGDVGVRAQRFLSLGREGIAKLAREAHEKGLILDQQTIDAAQKFRAAKRATIQTLVAFRNEIASRMLPAITAFVGWLNAWWQTGNNAAVATAVLTTAVKALGIALAALGMRLIILQVRAFAVSLFAAAAAVKVLAQTILFAAGKMITIVAPFVALFLIVRALVRFAQGKGGFLDRMMGDGAAAKALREVLQGIAEMGGLIAAEFAPLADAIAEPLAAAARTVAEIFAEIDIDLTSVIRAIVKGLRFALVGLISIIWLVLFVFLQVVRGIKWGIGQIGDLFMWLGRQAGDAADWIGRKWGELGEWLLSIFARIGVMWDGLLSVMSGAWGSTASTIKGGWTGLKDFAKGIATSVGSFFAGAADRAGAAWKSVIAAIEKAINFIRRKLGGAVSAVKGALGVTPESTNKGSVTAAEQGGLGFAGFGGAVQGLLALPPTAPPVSGAPTSSIQSGGTRNISATSNVGTITIPITVGGGGGVETAQAITEGLDREVRKIMQRVVNQTARDIKRSPA